jgi:hypothetical protein
MLVRPRGGRIVMLDECAQKTIKHYSDFQQSVYVKLVPNYLETVHRPTPIVNYTKSPSKKSKPRF